MSPLVMTLSFLFPISLLPLLDINHHRPIWEYKKGQERRWNHKEKQTEMTSSCKIYMEHNTSTLDGVWNIVND